jgi:hypothetical protein
MASAAGYRWTLWACFSLFLPLLALSQEQVEFDESFNPTALRDWPSSKAKVEYIASPEVYGSARSDTLILPEEPPEYVFRVQLGSTTEYEEAIELETRARFSFDEVVVLAFDSPYYKVRVGKYADREEAQALQREAVKEGYRRAWVLRTENDAEDTE